MAGTHGVDVEALHQTDVAEHILVAYGVAVYGVQFMTVHTFEKDRLSVYQHLGVLDFHFAETYLQGDYFGNFLAIHQCGGEGVEVGCLGRPLVG